MGIKRLIREYQCDFPHCSSMAKIETGSMSYGTDYEGETRKLRDRGWLVEGMNYYCKAHAVPALHETR